MQINKGWYLLRTHYLDYLLIWILIAVISECLYHVKNKYANKIYKFITVFGLAIYSYIVLYITLLGRTQHAYFYIDINPLWNIERITDGDFYYFRQVLSNLVMLVPFGWYLPSISRILSRKATLVKTVLAGMIVSIAIETCQLIFKLGYFEVSDIVSNTIGVLAGHLFWKLCTNVFKRIFRNSE